MATDMPAEFRDFLEKLIEEKKYENLSDELREVMIGSLYPRLQAYIFTAITKDLDSETLQELNRIIEGNINYSQPEIQMFLRGRIKNIDEITAEAMLHFRDTYLNA